MESVVQPNNDVPVPWAWIRNLRQLVNNAELPFRDILPAELLPWLYISDECSALDKQKLNDLGITHVLSMNGVPSYRDRFVADFYQGLGIHHLRIHAEDREGYNLMEKHGDECLEFLNSVRERSEKEGCKVVVHCVAGINRSGLVACAALMMYERKSVLDAVRYVIERRGVILSNKSFQKELCVLASKWDLLGDPPVGFSDDPIEETPIAPPPMRAFDSLI